MKISKIIISGLMLALCAFTFTSCDLDKEYDASMDQEKIFGNATETRGFLANIYTNLPDGFAPLSDDQFTGASRDCMTDNAVTSWGLHYYTKIGSDGYTAADHPLLGFWNTDLYGIRKCNQFIRNARESVIGNAVTGDDESQLYNRYIAEARLLRAIFHFDLICWFGDAPILGGMGEDAVIFDLTSDMNISRTNKADALDWVIEECNAVKDVLPFRYANEASNWGRVNGAAAYALISRASLYRASEFYRKSGDNEQQLWQAAADAAVAFINKNNQQSRPYGLLNTGNPDEDYYDIFTENPVYSDEFILSRSVWFTNQVEKVFAPVGFTGSWSAAGRTNPTQNFVDCFETIDGKKISDADSGYDPQHPYENRDPRLSQIVFYHNMTWGRADQEEERQLDMSSNTSGTGIDYSSSMGGTYTGYYLKKFVNNISCKAPTTFNHAWPIFRFTEILLNAAEAYCEADQTGLAETYINQIRDRAGMPHYTGLTQAALLERIRNERRIELSFEDHRRFDLTRWMAYSNHTGEGGSIYDVTNSSTSLLHLYGVTITGDDVVNNPVFTYGLAETVNSRVFNVPKNYLFPIPENEVKRCPNLGQNPGWETSGN